MLEEINPLPRAKPQPARSDRDRNLRLGQGGADMRGHVVQSFALMEVAPIIFRRKLAEKTLQIGADIRVRIFLNEEGRRGMATKNREEAARYFLRRHPSGNGRGDLDQPLTIRRNLKMVKDLMQDGFPFQRRVWPR